MKHAPIGFSSVAFPLTLLLAGLVAAQTAPPRKDIPTIAKAANGAIVSIIMSDKDGKPVAQGSGFLISSDGVILTNYHVIAEGSSAIVKLPDGAFYVVDGVLASNKARDVAVIKAHGENFRTLTLGDSDQIQVGEEVVAIGNPLSLESTVSNGIVSGMRAVKEEGGNFLQITAPISPGSSGGPLFNMVGEVIGITTMYLNGGENLNFAIPINDAKRLLQIKSSKIQALPNEPEPVEAQTHDAEAPKRANPQEPNAGLTPPEIVHLEEVQIKDEVKTLTVGNVHRSYHLGCNATLDSCQTPVPDKDYLVFSKTTRWQMPGAKEALTLKFLQDWSVIYNNQENVALFPADPNTDSSFGMYMLLSVVPASPETAREYYNELKAANNFTHYKDIYVCFRDEDLPSFSVIGRGSDIIEEMKKAGSAPDRAIVQAKSFLFVETYYKGVAQPIQLYSPVAGKEGTDYDIEAKEPIHARMVYSINWVTGRYRLLVYALDQSKTIPAYEGSGKCELIHPNVPMLPQ